MVEGARLESVYTPKAYRGFESLLLRQFLGLCYRAFLMVTVEPSPFLLARTRFAGRWGGSNPSSALNER